MYLPGAHPPLQPLLLECHPWVLAIVRRESWPKWNQLRPCTELIQLCHCSSFSAKHWAPWVPCHKVLTIMWEHEHKWECDMLLKHPAYCVRTLSNRRNQNASHCLVLFAGSHPTFYSHNPTAANIQAEGKFTHCECWAGVLMGVQTSTCCAMGSSLGLSGLGHGKRQNNNVAVTKFRHLFPMWTIFPCSYHPSCHY